MLSRSLLDQLENLEVMLDVIQTFGSILPKACQNTCEEAWPVFDLFITKYGSEYDVAERTTRILRHALTLFGDSAIPTSILVMARMSISFETTGFPGYLWIASKIISLFGNEENPALRASFQEIYERSTANVISLLQVKLPRDIPDGNVFTFLSGPVLLTLPIKVLDDYLRMLMSLADFAPDIFYRSPTFALAFRALMASLTLVQADAIFGGLELARIIFSHDCLVPVTPQPPPPKFPEYAAVIKAVIQKDGFEFVGYLLTGLVGDFPEDSVSTVIAVFRAISAVWPSQLLSWLPVVLQQLPAASAPNQTKTDFMSDVTRFVLPFSFYAHPLIRLQCHQWTTVRQG